MRPTKYSINAIILLLIILGSVVLSGCLEAPKNTTAVQSETPPDNVPETHTNGNLSSEEIRELEQLVFEETNQVRADREIDKLVWDQDLARVSDYHAWNMAEEEFKSHIEPDGDTHVDRFNQFGYACTSNDLGEVIAIVYRWENFTIPQLAEHILNLWLESSAHRDGILQNGTRFAGVGAYNLESGEVYVVQMFCSDVERLSTSQSISFD